MTADPLLIVRAHALAAAPVLDLAEQASTHWRALSWRGVPLGDAVRDAVRWAAAPDDADRPRAWLSPWSADAALARDDALYWAVNAAWELVHARGHAQLSERARYDGRAVYVCMRDDDLRKVASYLVEALQAAGLDARRARASWAATLADAKRAVGI